MESKVTHKITAYQGKTCVGKGNFSSLKTFWEWFECFTTSVI